MAVEGTDLPLWGMEVDPEQAKEEFRASMAKDSGAGAKARQPGSQRGVWSHGTSTSLNFIITRRMGCRWQHIEQASTTLSIHAQFCHPLSAKPVFSDDLARAWLLRA